MKKQDISAIKIAMVYIGTVVGAGFATGQEILQFFVHFGLGGFWGILLSVFLFISYGYLIMMLGKRFAAKSHKEVVVAIGGTHGGQALDTLIMLSLFFALTAMMAGSGALFSQEFGISPLLGSALMGVATAFTVLRGLRGVINAISAVVPFLLFAVIGICLYAIVSISRGTWSISQTMTEQNFLMQHWFFAALLYGAYNILMSASILAPLGNEASSRRSIFYGAAWGGIGLGAASLLIYFALGARFVEIHALEVPLLYLAAHISPLAGLLFAFVLLAEIYTTAVSALYGFSARLGANKKITPKTAVLGATGIAFLASLFGFSNLVRYLYPLQGYGGLLFLGVLFFAVKKIRHHPTA